MATTWRVLIVEDDKDVGKTLVDAIEAEAWLDDDNRFVTQLVTSFEQALTELERSRFDLLVLDLKEGTGARTGGGEEEARPGLNVLERLRSTRFVPVIFYTALPEHVEDLRSAFVRVVEKTEGYQKVRTEIGELIKTRLPHLARYLEEQQRQYFWEFIEKNLPADLRDGSVDLTHLMARRLAASLRAEFSKAATAELGGEQPAENRIHPMEFYILPPVKSFWMSGDLVKRKNTTDYFVVVTPTCDFANDKADFVILAKCLLLTEAAEYAAWRGPDTPPTFQGSNARLQKLMADNREGGQRERFMFLPGTSKFPDFVVDLQQLTTVPKDERDNFDRMASLDSPFAEKLVSLFARYYGRIGTPNLDVEITMTRARTRATAPAAPPPTPEPAAER